MDSPLSDIDANEIIADSEDDGYQGEHTAKNITSAGKGFGPLHSADRQQQIPINMPDGKIDYFAGFKDDTFLPVPSIAERAKTRQRKTKSRPTQDILELTDDDELMLNPRPSRSKKKKSKEKTVRDLPEANHGTNSNSASTPLISGPRTTDHTPLINARNKIRPRLIKKTPPPPHSPKLGQISLPVSTSPSHSPPNYFADSSSRFELPLDSSLTSTLARDRGTHLPPIEFLPPQEDTDTPLPSSPLGENVDELQDHHDKPDVDHGDILPPPPPTFFAGSSSLPPPAVPSPLPPPPHPMDIFDLTNVPNTSTAFSIGAPDPSTKVKVKKPRKPRKKKGEVDDADSGAVDVSQVNNRRKKGKAKANQVIVEIPLLPPAVDKEQDTVPTVKKRRRKQILDDPMEEDELNIGAGQSDPFVDVSVNQPSPTFEGNDEQREDDVDTFDLNDLAENPLKADRRKGKKRRSEQEMNSDTPSTTISRRRKSSLHSIEAGGQEQTIEDIMVPSKRASKKGNIGDENPNIEAPQASGIKGKRRMVIASDDEVDDSVDLIAEEPRASSPDPAERPKANGKSLPGDDAAKAADHQDDRNVLRHIQPVGAQSSSPRSDTVMSPPYETPAARYPSLASRYTIAPKSRTSGMTELIRRAGSHVNSPLAAPNARGSPLTRPVYSPLLKSSRRSLSRIAPLHPNRRTPPPPLPPPPPKKKSKKEQELEEKWEEEIIEEIGGINEWLALSEAEKKDLKRLKRDREMGYCED